MIHAVSLIRNPLIRNSPEDSWKNRKWNPEPFEPKVQNKKEALNENQADNTFHKDKVATLGYHCEVVTMDDYL